MLISPQQLQRDLAFWIEGDNHRERRHSTTGYLCPIDEQINQQAWRASACGELGAAALPGAEPVNPLGIHQPPFLPEQAASSVAPGGCGTKRSGGDDA